MDLLKPFFDECCLADREPHRWEYAEDLYKAYVKWHGDEKAMFPRYFGLALKERGFTPGSNGAKRLWRGIELLAAFKPKRKSKPKRKREPG